VVNSESERANAVVVKPDRCGIFCAGSLVYIFETKQFVE